MAAALTLEDLITDEKSVAKIGKLSFEDAMTLLDELVSKVESGGLPLEKVMICYERGSALMEHLRKQLSGAEEKLKVLQKGK